MGLRDHDANVEAAASAETSSPTIPFFHDFSCRENELKFLLAALRQVLSTGELSQEEQDVLQEFHDGDAAAAARVRPLALVSGHSGIGKSRLLEEAKEVARTSGVHVKEVFCYERQGIPFLPVLRVVKELLAEAPEPRHLWEPYAPVLTRVYPELAGQLGEAEYRAELPDDLGKVQLFHALTGVLCAVSRERPLLLLFHDLHRSDEGTVEFLEYLARNVVLEMAERGESGQAQLATTVATDGDGGEGNWKEIGQRERTAFITDGLSSDTSTPGAPVARLMAVVNYLDLPAAAGDAVEVAVDAKATTKGSKGKEPAVDPGPSPRSAMQARLSQLRRGPFARSLQLAPLNSEQLGGLVARTLRVPSIPAKVTERIHEVVQGNPLYALEICRCLFEDGALRPGAEGANAAHIDTAALTALIEEVTAAPDDAAAEAAADDRPPSFPSECLAHRLVTRRVASLDSVQQQLVKVLATLRRPAPISRLVPLAGGNEKAVSAALDALHGRDFVKVVPVAGTPLYFLAHEAYTRGVYRHLPPDEARELHERVGRTLSALPEASEPVRAYEIYEHLRQSASPKESWAFGMTAARYFERGFALELAIKIETHLLSLLGSDEDQPQRQELLAELGRLHLRQGNAPAAKSFFKDLLDMSELEPRRRLQAYCELAETYRVAGEPHKGIKVLNRAEKQCSEAMDERAEARLCGLRARLRLERQDAKRAIHLCMRGLQTVENNTEADPERIELLETLAEAHLARAETVAALPHFQRLLELVEGVGDESKQAAILSRVGRVYYDRGNYFRAARFLFKALDVIRRVGDVQALSRAYDGLGKVYRNSGDNIRGLEYFNRSLRIRERTGDVEGLSPTLNSLGSLYAHNGNYYRAIRYFKRSIENSQRINNTAGLVRAFLHLGWVHYEIGEFRQVESLAKQILILSSEFDVDAELEGEGYRLRGNLYFERGDWKRTERAYRKAIEIASKRSRKKGEAAALLDLGELQYEREEYEAALKQISRGQLLAEEIRSMPLRARASLLKGHVYRSLKGGNSERAKECYHKGVELLSTEDPLPLMWELEYSLAKVHQESLEFAEARECYGRAEAILERIADSLPEDMKVAYRDDRRRKVFSEDYRRFQKEAAGRMSLAPGAEVAEREEKVWALPRQTLLTEEGASTPAVERVCTAIARITGSASCSEWGRQLVDEARRLVPSPSGGLVVAEVGKPESLRAIAARDLGADQEWIAPGACPAVFFEEAMRTGAPICSGGEEWSDRLAAVERGSAYRNRSIAIVPLRHGGRSFGALFLQRPSAGNPFSRDEMALLRRLVDTVAGQYETLLRLENIVMYHGGPLLSAAGFEDSIGTAAQGWLRGDEPFSVIVAQVPGFENRWASRADEADFVEGVRGAAGGTAVACGVLGGDRIAYLVPNRSDQFDSQRGALEEQLTALLQPDGAIAMHCVDPDPSAKFSAEVVERVLNACGKEGFDIGAEIEVLANGELSLKEAKSTLEKRYITAELFKSRGNITRAAESLGVHRPQLSNLIKKHNVNREDFE